MSSLAQWRISIEYDFKHYQGVSAKSGFKVSEDNDKAGLLVTNHGSSKAVQPLRHSFEIAGTGGGVWNTTTSGQLPRGLIRDYV